MERGMVFEIGQASFLCTGRSPAIVHESYLKKIAQIVISRDISSVLHDL